MMTTTTTFTGLKTNRSPGRRSLQPGQVSQLVVSDLETGTERVVFEIDTLIESPNWTPDGRSFIVNGSGNSTVQLLDARGKPGRDSPGLRLGRARRRRTARPTQPGHRFRWAGPPNDGRTVCLRRAEVLTGRRMALLRRTSSL
jgi:hypothetical protein